VLNFISATKGNTTLPTERPEIKGIAKEITGYSIFARRNIVAFKVA
jgi:hypothetical protein